MYQPRRWNLADLTSWSRAERQADMSMTSNAVSSNVVATDASSSVHYHCQSVSLYTRGESILPLPISIRYRYFWPNISAVSMSQGAYKFGKWNSPSFPGFPDPLNSLFQTTIKWKPDVTNHLSCQFGSFLAELQNILLKEHGDWLHPRQSLRHLTNLCSVTDNYAHNSMPERQIASQKNSIW